MTAAPFSFTGSNKIEAGTKLDVTIPVTNELGTALDLTNYDPSADVAHIGGRATFRRDVDDLNAVAAVFALGAAASDGAEGVWIVQPPTGGLVRIVIEADTTAAASFTGGAAIPLNRAGVFQVEVVTESENDALRIIEGGFEISPESTRPD